MSLIILFCWCVKVKQFHPDLNKDGKVSDLMIRRVIQAYEVLKILNLWWLVRVWRWLWFVCANDFCRCYLISADQRSLKGEIWWILVINFFEFFILFDLLNAWRCICRECLDPFEEQECEAFDIFVNEVLCVGKGINVNSRYAMFQPCLKWEFRVSNLHELTCWGTLCHFNS
jgi:hypothetical protein